MAEIVTEIVLSQSCVKRIVKDVKDIMKNPLIDQGIYYQHDESNVLTGYAMIVGPSDTPYENGFYLFKFNFPQNYPFSPPVVEYFTNDGFTRFNPNLYKCGKVCVSVLNTWKGESWTSCQTISSILLILCSLLSSNPIENEPGCNSNHPDSNSYNAILTYKNIEVAMCGMISRKYLNEEFLMFYPVMAELFIKNYDKTIDKIQKLETRVSANPNLYVAIYSMVERMDCSVLLGLMVSCREMLNN